MTPTFIAEISVLLVNFVAMKIGGKYIDSGPFVLMFLGALSAFGPFVMDMYIPVLPAMEDWFGCSTSLVQLGLTTGLIGLAAGQLIFGPLSDRYGRRKPLICATLLFIISTAGCIFSADVHQFIVMRLFQGLAGSGGVVLSRSIAADKYQGKQLTKMMSMVAAVNGIATVAAPIVGGFIALLGGWRAIFWSLIILAFILLIGAVRMHECLSFKNLSMYRKSSFGAISEGFMDVLRNRKFLRYVLIYMFSMGVLFTNIASAPFIMQEYYGLSSLHFSIVFGFNALTFAIASAVIPRFRTRDRAISFGTVGLVVLSVLTMLAFLFKPGFWVYEALIFILSLMVGMVSTASNVAAMDSGRDNAGVASALLGAIGNAFGGIIPAIVASGEMLFMTGSMFLLCSLLTAACVFADLFKKYRRNIKELNN